MQTRHRAQVDELNVLHETIVKTSSEINEQHILNNKRHVELHDLNVQCNCMEAQKEHQLRRIADIESLVEKRTVDITEAEKLQTDLQAEIAVLVLKISETQTKIDQVKAAIDTLVVSNEKLQVDVHNTSVKNQELCANINDLQVRSNALEARIAVMKNDSVSMN